ncbi:MAG: putative toxin-antitoxin system toxin component, PIN family [Proteobacteria bacterium]|nr:putative toxin-antitoxin system toxin component, PIN family [Pseudomonadota bacterium]
MRIVLDTNVLVSALLSPASFPARILAWVLSGDVALCVDARILAEYENVLSRPEFGFNPAHIRDLLDFIHREAIPTPALASPALSPDPADMVFIEVCLGGAARRIVTGTLKHFPSAVQEVVTVMSPKEFVTTFLKNL